MRSISSEIFFEAKVKYLSDGKKVTDVLVVAAPTFGNAEEKVNAAIKPIDADFQIQTLKKATYQEILLTDNTADERYYKMKVRWITIDGEKEKAQNAYYLVQAHSLEKAVAVMKHRMKETTLADGELVNIAETKVTEYYDGNVVPMDTIQKDIEDVTMDDYTPYEEVDNVQKEQSTQLAVTKQEDGVPTFDDFWEAYDKKVDRPRSERLWKKLKKEEKIQLMEYIPKYKDATPDKQYRKHPATFLNNKSWNDEIIQKQFTYEDYKRLSPNEQQRIYGAYCTQQFYADMSGAPKPDNYGLPF